MNPGLQLVDVVGTLEGAIEDTETSIFPGLRRLLVSSLARRGSDESSGHDGRNQGRLQGNCFGVRPTGIADSAVFLLERALLVAVFDVDVGIALDQELDAVGIVIKDGK